MFPKISFDQRVFFSKSIYYWADFVRSTLLGILHNPVDGESCNIQTIPGILCVDHLTIYDFRKFEDEDWSRIDLW